MNIKPTEQQVREWAEGAGEYADMKRKAGEDWDLLRDQKLAELATKWGAKQAQQPTVEEPDNVRHVLLAAMQDIGAVLNGNYDEDHLEKTCTKIAAILYGRAPSRAFEPELPEAVAYRQWDGDEGYWYYGDANCADKNDELLYTAAQMHAFADAKVRAAGSQDAKRLTKAAKDVMNERHRQISAEGWTPSHDDEHVNGEMAQAAGCYASSAGGYSGTGHWPWTAEWWKPGEPRRMLVKAGALILAEIERLDRAATKEQKQ